MTLVLWRRGLARCSTAGAVQACGGGGARARVAGVLRGDVVTTPNDDVMDAPICSGVARHGEPSAGGWDGLGAEGTGVTVARLARLLRGQMHRRGTWLAVQHGHL